MWWIPSSFTARSTLPSAAWGERRAEHPEVGRRLVREQLDVERALERAVQHQELPPAVRLRGLDERRLELEQGFEPVLRDDLGHARVVLGGGRMEADRERRPRPRAPLTQNRRRR